MDEEISAEKRLEEIETQTEVIQQENNLYQYLQVKVLNLQGSIQLKEGILNKYLEDMQATEIHITQVQWITENIVSISYMERKNG